MEKLSFIEKNDALVQLQDLKHYDSDCKLLSKVNPQSKLQNEIAKANEFNRNSLQGRILLELLDIVSKDDILTARAKKEEQYADEKPEGDQPEGDTSADEKPEGDQPEGDTSADEKPEGNTSADEKPEGNTSADEKPEGDQPEGNTSADEKPKSKSSKGSKSRVDKPKNDTAEESEKKKDSEA